ncbi:MAG TPA: glutamate-5-semialdehyde dehydrogenase [Candidatus Brocadiia bacterium]|nr:glutamate-5-semialdehyde dehydrogenase [Candidatus Brocadiales bacterium]
MDIKSYIEGVTKGAKAASRQLSQIGTAAKNAVLIEIANNLLSAKSHLKAENEKDIQSATNAGLSPAMIDRLRLTDSRIEAMADGVKIVAHLKDPVGEVIEGHVRPNGLFIQKVRVPIGVIAIIYESRPNVTADAASLCFKAGNASILRGGKEAIHSNLAIYKILASALEKFGLDKRCIQVIETIDRTAVDLLLQADKYIDVVIPRGGESLIRAVAEVSTIPVIKHYKGVCITYVDEFANLKMAEEICFNAKVQRPATCNAMETMLVHEKVASTFLPPMAKRMQEAGVELRGCEKTCQIIHGIKKATEADWYTEYLDLILNVKIVPSIDSAIEHITTYGSAHSDAIITENLSNANKFTREIDSACVFVNTSSRFSDGYEFGMGAEIGISTDKLHARGPMGLTELTSYKFIVHGNGQLRG